MVIGMGMVGKATAWAFGITDYIDLGEGSKTIEDAAQCKYVFLCLPTPTINGICQTKDTQEYIKKIYELNNDVIFIIRSTVVPGTTKNIVESTRAHVAHIPEFLTETTWKQDTDRPDLVVVGADDGVVRDKVSALFKSRYASAAFFITDTHTSELCKYAINTLYATKVIFANQIYDYCQKMGVNYETIKNILYSRKWIGKNHLDVWHKGKRGAGGKCLGKDVDAFAHHSKLELLELVNSLNKQYLESNQTDVLSNNPDA
jgi:UDPglucose 6-dehydrogenase